MLKFICSVVSASLLSVSAHATFITYSDRSTFEADTGASTQIDFEHVSTLVHLGSTYSENGLTMTDNASRLFILTPGTYGTHGQTPDNYLNLNSQSDQLTFEFDTAVYSLGFDIGNLHDWGQAHIDVTTITTSGEVFQVSTPDLIGNNGSLSFFGFASNSAFSTVIFSNPQEGLILDNIAYDYNPVAVSAPGSMALFGLVLLGFGIRRKPVAA